MIEKGEWRQHLSANLHRRHACRRLRRALRARGSRQARCAACGLRGALMNGSSTFRVGLIQMRSGRTPADNMDAAAKLIGEAKEGGADYVQTPEMTNILERSREKPVRHDRAGGERPVARDVPRACARARHLCACRLARREGFARQGGQPRVPDRPARRDRRALRQDPHVRRRPERRRELPRVAQLPARAISRSSPTCRGAGSA